MGNNEFSISASIRSQWGERSGVGRRIFFNKITLEEFQLIILSKLQNGCSIPQLVHRSIHPLPATPKVIILNDRRGELSLLAQRPAAPLAAALARLPLALQVLKTLLRAALALQALCLRYGPFALAPAMLAATHTGEPLLWINSSFERSDIQNPLPSGPQGEQAMVRQAAFLFREMLPSEFFKHNVLAGPIQSFERLLQKLEEAIEQERNSISSHGQRWRPVVLTPGHSFSPRNTFEHMKPLPIQSSSSKPITSANNIPAFIKKFKDEKGRTGKSPLPARLTSAEGGRNAGRAVREGKAGTGAQGSKIAKMRSLNGSPEANKMAETLKSTANSFSNSRGRLEVLAFSRHSSKGQQQQPQLNVLEIPLIHSLSSIEMPGNRLIPEVSEEEVTDREVTFNVPAHFASGRLNSFCKTMSHSQELRESMAKMLEPDLSLQMQAGLDESVVIHNTPESGSFDGQYLVLYEEIGKILF